MSDKARRKALLTVKRLHRAPGGSLSDAMNSFARRRQSVFDQPSASAQNAYQGIPQEYFNRPELAIAQPEQEQRSTPMAQSADLGSALEDGVNWIQGKDSSGKSVAKAPSPTNKALEDPTTTSVAPQLSGARLATPGKPGQFRPQYNLSAADLNPAVINTIAGEASTRDPAATDAVINNMVNRLGSKGYGPSGNLYEVARAPGQYTGYRQASPEEAQFIRSRMQAIANGSMPDNTNGSMEYRGAWLYNKAAGMHPDGVGVGGNWFFKTPVQPGPYAARQADTEEAGNATPDPAPQQRTAAQQPAPPSAAPRGHLQITDPNQDPLTSHAYPAPNEHAAPPVPPPPAPPIQAQGAAPPPPQLQDATAGPQASADPQSNLYDKVAFMPSVQSGYDNPQVLYDPTQQAAKGGSIKSMPSPELIAKALQILARRKAATGGAQAPTAAPTLDSLNTQYQQLAAQQAQTQARQRSVDSQLGQQAAGQIMDANENGGRGGVQGAIDAPESMLGAIGNNVNPQNNTPAPTPPAAPITPALQGQSIGNAAGATGAGLGNIPMASPGGNGTGGAAAGAPNYNNTLDEALGTNSPTMNQIFGFNYPVPPPPKPQPQGPVSQNEINGLYGFGGGSQMGTGTFADGGAIVMDALLRANRARKAKGKR